MAEGRAARPERAAREGGDVDIDRDRALVLRCQEGDGAAFAELYTQYHDRLHRFCMRRLLDRDEAEEVAQEAFLRAWRALPGFAGGLRFYPWLTVIAKNLCTDAQRRRARYGEVADLDRHATMDATRFDPFSTAMSSEDTVMASFEGQLAAEALTRLSDRHRHVLSLREENGLTYQEIASAEGVEVSTVETLLWRARQALKREYVLSGTRVLGGVLVAGGAMRRLLERLSRRAARLVAAASRIRARDLAAAGVVTVALASVAGAPSISAKAVPAAPPAATVPAANASSTGGTTSTGTTSPASSVPAAGPTTSTGAPATPTGGSSAAAGLPGGGGSAPTAPLPAGVSEAGSQVTSQVTSQVSSIVNDVTSTLGQVTSGASGLTGSTGGAVPQLPVPPTVQKTVSGVGGLLGH